MIKQEKFSVWIKAVICFMSERCTIIFEATILWGDVEDSFVPVLILAQHVHDLVGVSVVIFFRVCHFESFHPSPVVKTDDPIFGDVLTSEEAFVSSLESGGSNVDPVVFVGIGQ